jgi:hypothetical protein
MAALSDETIGLMMIYAGFTLIVATVIVWVNELR